MIEIHNARKVYRQGDDEVVACQVGELTIVDREQVALIGRSGSGKSTLLNMIAGIVRPSSGSVRVAGRELSEMSESERDRFRGEHIGMVFQTFNLLQPFNAVENVLLGATFGRKAPGTRERALELLTTVGLGDRLHHRPGQLSVGQMQRVAICRALINQPALILADEPLGNQDPETGREVLDLLLRLAREEGRTVVMVTHDPASAALMERTVDLMDLQSEVAS
ncbi:MAG: ABC transporter ATP-binding protein [Planctomycetota bacterium]